MASSSPGAAAAGGGEIPPPAEGAFDYRVYAAVASGKSTADVIRLIEEIAQGDDEKRKAAVRPSYESPLQAAFRLGRKGLQCRLLVAGADVTELFNGKATALGVCCMYGCIKSMRELLKKGCDVNERLGTFWRSAEERLCNDLTAAHVCACYGQLECLRALVQEGNADINARDEDGDTPIFWMHLGNTKRVGALVALGADLEAQNNAGRTALFVRAEEDDLFDLLALLDAGASPDVFDNEDNTPLIIAARYSEGPNRQAVIEALIRRSSPDTLRAVNLYGNSAADWLVKHHVFETPDAAAAAPIRLEPWELRALAELKRLGTPLQPSNALRAMPSAAAHAQRQVAELAVRRSEPRRWRAYDCIVPLAFDYRDAREADERVAWREARVKELEEELRELGYGTHSSEDEEEEEEEEEDAGAALPLPSTARPRRAASSTIAAAAAAAAAGRSAGGRSNNVQQVARRTRKK